MTATATNQNESGIQSENEDEEGEEAAEFRVGDEVEGKYKNGRWYPAVVKEVQEDGTYLLDWNDGDSEDRVKSARQLRRAQVSPNTFPVGIEIKGVPLSNLRGRYEVGHWDLSESKMKKVVYVIEWIAEDAVNKKNIVEVNTKPYEFRVGDSVDGQYKNGRWYPAVIEERRPDGAFVLKWEDGDTADRVKSARELRPKIWDRIGHHDFLLLSVQKFNHDDEEGAHSGGVRSDRKVKQVSPRRERERERERENER